VLKGVNEKGGGAESYALLLPVGVFGRSANEIFEGDKVALNEQLELARDQSQ